VLVCMVFPFGFELMGLDVDGCSALTLMRCEHHLEVVPRINRHHDLHGSLHVRLSIS
jgi:hypothetical protein